MRHFRLKTLGPAPQDLGLVTSSLLFRKLSAKLKAINEHKWYESEREGHDIGFDRALVSWIVKHSRGWKKRQSASDPAPREQ